MRISREAYFSRSPPPPRKDARAPLPERCSELKFQLERKAQGHLDLPRASNCFCYLPQTTGTVVEIAGWPGSAATGAARRRRWSGCRTYLRKLAVGQVLRDVIDGDVEAGCVRHVKNVKGVLQRKPLRQSGYLRNRDIRVSLPRLTEDVALARGEICFVVVTGSNAIARAGRQ